MGLLSESAAQKYDRLRPYGFLIVLGLIYLGVLSIIIRPIEIIIYTLIFSITMSEYKKKPIVFSGIRPTGPAHLGNYAGAMRNWVRLQDEYQCYYSIVTWHALSSEYQNSKVIREYTLEMANDLLSIGSTGEVRPVRPV